MPSIANYPTFTDFLLVVISSQEVLRIIEVKKATIHTSLHVESDSAAQELREAHILLANSTEEGAKLPFLLNPLLPCLRCQSHSILPSSSFT